MSGVESEIGLRVALKDRVQAAAGLKATREDVEQVGDAAERTGRKSRVGFATIAKGAVIAGGAVIALGVGAGKALYKVGSTFDDMSDTIRVGTGATGKSLAGLTASAKRVGHDIPVAFDQIGPTVADINTRLGLTGPVLEKLSKQFLEAGRITGEAIDVKTISGAFNAFDVKGKQTTKVMDELYRVSQATGVGINDLASSVQKNAPNLRQFGFSIEDSAALVGTLDKAGLDSNKTLATLSRAMVQFAKDGKDPQQALRGTIDQISAFTKQGNDAAAINLAGKIFGTRGAGQFVAAIKSGRVNLDALMKGTGATSDTILKASKDTADFSEQWQLFKNRALLKLEPVASRVFTMVGNGMALINRRVVPAVSRFVHQMQTGEGAGGRFADVLRRTWGELSKVVAIIRTAVGWMNQNRAVVGTFVGVILVLVGAYKVWVATQWLLNAALTANPIGLVVVAIAALAAGVVYAYKHSEKFRAIVDATFGFLRTFVPAAVGFVVDFVRNHWQLLGAILLGPFGVAVLVITKNWDRIKSGAAAAKDFIVGKFEALISFYTRMPGRIAGAARGLFDGIKEAFRAAINWIVDKWNGLSFSIPGVDTHIPGVGKVGGFTLGTPDIPRLAKGGIVTRPTIALIGEAGPEAVVPLSRRRVPGAELPAGISQAGLDAQVDTDSSELRVGPAWPGGPITVQLVVDRQVLGEVVLDNIDDRMARR